MTCSEMLKEQEVQERFLLFLLEIPTLTSQTLEMVLLKVSCAVHLVLCMAVIALSASPAANHKTLDRHHLPKWWVLQFPIGTCGCACTHVECSALCPWASAWHFHALIALSLASGGAACGLLQPSALYWAPSDCHILGEWMFSAWLQQLSQSPYLTQRSDVMAQMVSERPWLMQTRTVWHRLPLPAATGESRSWVPLLHVGTRGRQPDLPQGWAGMGTQFVNALLCPSPPGETPAWPTEGMTSRRLYLLT